jgi:transketolase
MNTKLLAKNMRLDITRMINKGGSAHIGTAFSCTDILAVLYGNIMTIDPKNPKKGNRDRFILSKGHAGSAVYAVLAECGFFPKKKLMEHYADGSDLSGHVSHKGIPGVELSTGSLGHGLSVATGMAYAAKLDKKEHRVYALLGDGECDEGSNWEAIMFAAHHKLNNLIAIIDYNKLQSLTSVEDTLALEPFVDKWKSFNWDVIETDGHDHQKLEEAFNQTKTMNRPVCVIAHTTKGKGVSFMENSVLWHYRIPRDKEFEDAITELEKN